MFLGLDIPQIDHLLNCIKSLGEIAFIPNIMNPPRPTLTGGQVEGIIQQFIVNQSALEYLYVSTRGHFKRICTAIQLVLMETKERKQSRFGY